jgi:multicomponent Na+:H+ antiporter subunit G
MMNNIASCTSLACLSLGAIFLLIAGIGVLRLPDVYCRASAATKAATLGLGLILIGVAFHFGSLAVTTRVIATIAFVLLTSPISAHVICRAAYHTGVPLTKETVLDELSGPAG